MHPETIKLPWNCCEMAVMVGKRRPKQTMVNTAHAEWQLLNRSLGTSCSWVVMMEPAQLQDYLVDGPFLKAV
jgi:hypothetical protein